MTKTTPETSGISMYGCDWDRWPLCCTEHKTEVYAEMRADAIKAAQPETCIWMIEVASGNPEPDSYADTVKVIDCGAVLTRFVRNGSHGWECERGHHGWEYDSPEGQALLLEEEFNDRQNGW